ncbi:uncharacterized protein LOC133799589 [Humulus lupulus]|uniref:uncharacterized protein LOC133799589 n=1 Tax=Humulus lupulus TaxID=3486 RepID=UPI002B405FF8|nr:uncharacterized protein LOC133799589 [Humulus lupulus]
MAGKETFLVTYVYALNDENGRVPLWNDLKEIAAMISGPWLILGDFNDILSAEERIGGKYKQVNSGAFKECVESCGVEDEGLKAIWKERDTSTPMSQLVKKLKRVKQLLKEMNKSEIGDIQAANALCYQAMIDSQIALQQKPYDKDLITQEKEVRARYNATNKRYLSFLYQKAKVQWLKEGDDNTNFFHKSIKMRRAENRIYAIQDMDGVWVDKPNTVVTVFMQFYQRLLGSKMEDRKPVQTHLVNRGPRVINAHCKILLSEYDNDEVKVAMFEIPGSKAPGPDGFSSFFFQDNWEVVGNDVCEAVRSFLHSGKLLKEINSTTLTLIPKGKCPESVKDYRPIACCNVIYKVETKMICKRLRQVLPDIIAPNQSCFVQGRTPRYSLMFNGVLHGFFEAKRGLRQRDPLSPLLFVLGMEYLSRIMMKVGMKEGFKFYDRCESLKLNHLCFADDVLLFCHGDYKSIHIMLQGLKLFSLTFGLHPNETKTSIYYSNMAEAEIKRVTAASGFTSSKVPFCCLGIPICPTRISAAECDILVEKMVQRIKAQVLILPQKVLQQIASICRNFLWKGGAEFRSSGLVSWEDMCKAKKTRGLGLRKIKEWNIAAMGKYVWAVAIKKDSLWVKWIHAVYIKDTNWWNYKAPNTSSWYWKQLVKVKEKFKDLQMLKLFSRGEYKINTKHWLQLKERLFRFNVAPDEYCLLCGTNKENRDHLFFECHLCFQSLTQIKDWLGWRTAANTIQKLLRWIAKARMTRFRKQVYSTTIAALVYHLWWCRNEALWSHKVYRI